MNKRAQSTDSEKMDMPDKKDSLTNNAINNNSQGVDDNSLVDREPEDRERRARDLKIGLDLLMVLSLSSIHEF